MPAAENLGHPNPDMWPGEETYLLRLEEPYRGNNHVVVCLQSAAYGTEMCAKVFPADADGHYAGGPSFEHVDRFDYGTLQAVASQLGYRIAEG